MWEDLEGDRNLNSSISGNKMEQWAHTLALMMMIRL
jgi:hypothetical protein